jgi:hypothetical protein
VAPGGPIAGLLDVLGLSQVVAAVTTDVGRLLGTITGGAPAKPGTKAPPKAKSKSHAGSGARSRVKAGRLVWGPAWARARTRHATRAP